MIIIALRKSKYEKEMIEKSMNNVVNMYVILLIARLKYSMNYAIWHVFF